MRLTWFRSDGLAGLSALAALAQNRGGRRGREFNVLRVTSTGAKWIALSTFNESFTAIPIPRGAPGGEIRAGIATVPSAIAGTVKLQLPLRQSQGVSQRISRNAPNRDRADTNSPGNPYNRSLFRKMRYLYYKYLHGYRCCRPEITFSHPPLHQREPAFQDHRYRLPRKKGQRAISRDKRNKPYRKQGFL